MLVKVVFDFSDTVRYKVFEFNRHGETKMPAQQPQGKMTVAEYLEMERASLDIKHEFYDGEVFAMVGASRHHNRINVNIAGELRTRLKSKPCDLFSNDMRVKTGVEKYSYPDIVLYCGDAEFEDNKFDTLTNPVVIIEILSDSTEAYDRGDKFELYRRLPTVKEYILVSQKKYWIGQYVRQQSGQWTYDSYEGVEQVLKIESVGCELPLSEIYLNMEEGWQK